MLGVTAWVGVGVSPDAVLVPFEQLHARAHATSATEREGDTWIWVRDLDES
jgi:hypothetical protein